MTQTGMAAGGDPPTWYHATAHSRRSFAPLDGDARCDLCVIGGGYAGTSAALVAAERGLRVILIEKDRIGHLASGRNGGQLHTGQRLDQDALEAIAGKVRARALWDMAEEAKSFVVDRIKRHAINCALTPGLIHAGWKKRDAAALEAYGAFLARDYGYPHNTYVAAKDIPALVATDRYHGALYDRGAWHLHALNFVTGLGNAAADAGARICENTCAISVDAKGITTDRGRIEAGHIIIAADTGLSGIARQAGAYALPINSFVMTTAPLADPKALIPSGAAVADTKFVVDYYRLTEDGRLLFGGGENYRSSYPRDLAAFTGAVARRVFPQLADVAIDYAWGGPVGITMSRLPHFGRLYPNVYFAHGFSGQGVAIAAHAGALLAEAVLGQAAKFDVYAGLKHTRFPGGAMLRAPLMALGMLWYALRDRL